MHDPKLHRWYSDEDSEDRVEVIAIKEDYIIAQRLDGSVVEYSQEEWADRAMTPTAAPQEWELSWDNQDNLDEFSDERYEFSKRSLRHAKDEEDEDFEDFSFSEDFDDQQDLET